MSLLYIDKKQSHPKTVRGTDHRLKMKVKILDEADETTTPSYGRIEEIDEEEEISTCL